MSDEALDGAHELVIAELGRVRPTPQDNWSSGVASMSPAPDGRGRHPDERSGNCGVETEVAQLEDSFELRPPFKCAVDGTFGILGLRGP